MVWPLLIMAGMSMLQSGQQNNAAAAASVAEGKAVKEANLKNFTNTAFSVGLLNVQKGQQTKELAQRKADLGADELGALGTAAVNAAASGTVGASVDAVQTDIQMAYDRQLGLVNEENELNAQNYNTALHDLITNGQNQIQTPGKPQTTGQWAMLAGAAMAAGSKYASSKMDLGLGKTPEGTRSNMR